MGVDEGQEGSKLYLIRMVRMKVIVMVDVSNLCVILDSVQLPDAFLQLSLQYQSHAIEKLERRIATETDLEVILIF